MTELAVLSALVMQNVYIQVMMHQLSTQSMMTTRSQSTKPELDYFNHLMRSLNGEQFSRLDEVLRTVYRRRLTSGMRNVMREEELEQFDYTVH